MNDYVLLDHGSGGTRTDELVERVFRRRFANDALNAATDAALLDYPGGRLALTTDAHAVKPLFFPGGDIGRLAVAGTVNDLAVCAASPRHLTASFVIEEGFAMADLERIADSMAQTAAASGVEIVAGDTKVTPRGECDGLLITTAGLGMVPRGRTDIARGRAIREGDLVIVNGTLADHGAAILCARNDLETDPPVLSDCAPLADLIAAVLAATDGVHFMRDATRGGVATVLSEVAERRRLEIELDEERIPVREEVRGLCEMFGLDPLYLANEGNAVMIAREDAADAALEAMHRFPTGRNAAMIGRVTAVTESAADARVVLRTAIGGSRILRRHAGAQLPRIC